MTRRLTGVLGVLVLLATAAACTDNKDAADADDAGSLSVKSTNTECNVSKAEAPSGNLRFAVTNDGSKVTEFYLLAADGLRIVGEVENIGPGATRDLVVTAEPGTYQTACKPGMVGDGIRNGFKVTDSGKDLAPKGKTAAAVKTAIAQYELYVQGPDRAAAHQDRGVRRAVQGRQGRRGPGAVRRGSRALGAHRAGRRVLRHPRPPARPAGGGPRGGSGLDRLARHREGPVAAGVRVHAADPGSSATPSPTSSWPTRRSSTTRSTTSRSASPPTSSATVRRASSTRSPPAR